MKKIDFLLFAIITILTIFGLLMIYNSSSVIALRDFGDKYHFIKDQSLWVILGFISLITISQIDYHKLYHLALPLLIIVIGLLIAVFLPGIGVFSHGAHRWINIGSRSLQPAEFVKLALAIYLSAWFSTKEKGRFSAFALLLGGVIGLVMLEPDMGTASIILFEAIVIYFLSGGSIKSFLISIPVIAAAWFILIRIAPYRFSRLTSHLNLGKGDSLDGISYHSKQILIALGSGGIFGLGIGNSIQKYAYLPEIYTDSIFPIIAEEFGFIRSVALIILYLIIVWRGFYISMTAKDTFGKLLAAGIISFLGIQIIINLGAMTAIFPLTGVPLPFISYGGSALIVDMASIGILLNISRQSHNTTYSEKKRNIFKRKR